MHECLTRTGVALGASGEARYEQKVIRLNAGDNLLFYTDGLTESFNNEGGFFGDARLAKTLVSNSCSWAHDVIEVAEKTLLDFVQDMPAADDLTMLVVRRK